jgi:putative membrane protein
MTTAELPSLYTLFNACALIHIILGLIMIKRGHKEAHIVSMAIALLFSAAFLGCYLYYHFTIGHVRFAGQGWTRPVYFTLLLTHIPLAVLNLPMIIMTVMPALKHRFDKHKRMARWTVPIWLYVSVTGIIVYFMCYVWFGPPIRA